MMAEGHGSEYIAFKSLEEARSRSDSVVIMQGDDGGTIYLTIPVRNVSCGQASLNQLLVPRHSDYDWLILSQSRMGKCSGATRIWMLLATPG